MSWPGKTPSRGDIDSKTLRLRRKGASCQVREEEKSGREESRWEGGEECGVGAPGWVAQSVEHLTWAQVRISGFMSSSPLSGSVLTAQSFEPPSDSVSPSLSLPLPCSISVSLSKINIKHF